MKFLNPSCFFTSIRKWSFSSLLSPYPSNIFLLIWCYQDILLCHLLWARVRPHGRRRHYRSIRMIFERSFPKWKHSRKKSKNEYMSKFWGWKRKIVSNWHARKIVRRCLPLRLRLMSRMFRRKSSSWKCLLMEISSQAPWYSWKTAQPATHLKLSTPSQQKHRALV